MSHRWCGYRSAAPPVDNLDDDDGRLALVTFIINHHQLKLVFPDPQAAIDLYKRIRGGDRHSWFQDSHGVNPSV